MVPWLNALGSAKSKMIKLIKNQVFFRYNSPVNGIISILIIKFPGGLEEAKYIPVWYTIFQLYIVLNSVITIIDSHNSTRRPPPP